jgi:alkylation response protein AidB-like acyl-CoA dehydrogenase
MTAYAAPLAELRFAIEEIAGLPELARLPAFADATPDLVETVLAEAGKLAAGVLDPLNQPGDREGCRLENGVVVLPGGFAEAYRTFAAGGWNAVPFDPAFGGQGLPWSLQTALHEMWAAANLSFSLCPMLTQGVIELLQAHGSPAQKAAYLPKLIEGRWAGTMNLTEPQAGSDLGALKTRARREGERYRITGQKIFITYGEHELAENIVHMVLARLEDAPPGVRGISLFLVPKLLPGEGGPARNDLRCVALERKLGIHASPTCVMAYGDDDGAVGELVGEANRGLEYMFTMMNNARLGVGIQGIAVADRAYQRAVAYARGRIQSRAAGAREPAPVPIIRHPDVRRMLMTMRALTEAARALAFQAAGALDRARHAADPAERARQQARVDLLIPVVKAWSTDIGVEVASLGIQVHGGMGFIEEPGAAQHLRDARITPIYEGTNGIQANDLVGRKLARDGGAAMRDYLVELKREAAAAPADLTPRLAAGIAALERAADHLVRTYPEAVETALAGATPFLRLLGTVAGGVLLARSAGIVAARRAAGAGDADFLAAKEATARFYADNILPLAGGLAEVVTAGGPSTLALDEDAF